MLISKCTQFPAPAGRGLWAVLARTTPLKPTWRDCRPTWRLLTAECGHAGTSGPSAGKMGAAGPLWGLCPCTWRGGADWAAGRDKSQKQTAKRITGFRKICPILWTLAYYPLITRITPRQQNLGNTLGQRIPRFLRWRSGKGRGP